MLHRFKVTVGEKVYDVVVEPVADSAHPQASASGAQTAASGAASTGAAPVKPGVVPSGAAH